MCSDTCNKEAFSVKYICRTNWWAKRESPSSRNANATQASDTTNTHIHTQRSWNAYFGTTAARPHYISGRWDAICESECKKTLMMQMSLSRFLDRERARAMGRSFDRKRSFSYYWLPCSNGERFTSVLGTGDNLNADTRWLGLLPAARSQKYLSIIDAKPFRALSCNIVQFESSILMPNDCCKWSLAKHGERAKRVYVNRRRLIRSLSSKTLVSRGALAGLLRRLALYSNTR